MSNSYKVYASKKYVDGLRPTIDSLSSRFAEYASDTLTWDGDTTGIEDYIEDLNNSTYYKISDVVLTADELSATTLSAKLSNGSEILFNAETGTSSGKFVIDYKEDGVVVGAFTYSQESQFDVLCVYNKEGYNGVYFSDGVDIEGERLYTISFTVDGYTGFTTTKLKEECLPEHTHDNAAVQPDWEENDETAAGYIKNRPFYGGVTYDTSGLETNISILNFENLSTDEYYQLSCGDTGKKISLLSSSSYLIDGASYEVTLEGEGVDHSLRNVTYTCTATFEAEALPEYITYLGNASLIDASIFINTGECFCIAIIMDNTNTEIRGETYITIDTTKWRADGSMLLNVARIVKSIMKSIDSEFLPVATSNVCGAVIVDEATSRVSKNPVANSTITEYVDNLQYYVKNHGILRTRGSNRPITRITPGNGVTFTEEPIEGTEILVADLTISANYTYGTEDLTAGTSSLETGSLYFVYE